jgi:hypothetical protein
VGREETADARHPALDAVSNVMEFQRSARFKPGEPDAPCSIEPETTTEAKMRSLAMLAAAVVMAASPAITSATPPCPPEVKEAKALLTAKTATAAKVAQPSKSQAGARGQDVQAPRGQEVQAPRGQDIQAPRGQDVQAPRNVAKGRTTALTNARRLVAEAETACKDADSERALANAHAALELLKYVP